MVDDLAKEKPPKPDPVYPELVQWIANGPHMEVGLPAQLLVEAESKPENERF